MNSGNQAMGVKTVTTIRKLLFVLKATSHDLVAPTLKLSHGL